MFTLHDTVKTVIKKLIKQLLKKGYRLCLYQENMSKNGTECNQHYHGMIEMDGEKDTSTNYEALRYILSKHCTDQKNHKCIKAYPDEDEKACFSYCSKQYNELVNFNYNYDHFEVAEWYKEQKKLDDAVRASKAKLMKEKLCAQFMSEDLRPNLQELKVWVARYLIDQDILPVMSKVRSYTMYIVHRCGLKYFLVEELDKLL